MSWIKTLPISMLIAVITFEFFSFIATKLDLFIVNQTPGIYLTGSPNYSWLIDDSRTEFHSWGAWKKPNSTTRQRSSCFDVEIKANELGARDDSFSDVPKNSILLLGDSFAEGYGVEHNQTSQYLIEEKTGRNVLNFGTAGSFGPLQQLLIYKELARELPHSSVLIYVLPANDFNDNDSEALGGSRATRLRYRPYFSTKGNPLKPWYFDEAKKNREYPKPSLIRRFKRILVHYTWSANALRTASYLLNYRYVNPGSYYLKASELQQKNLLLAHTEIVRLAGTRPVTFVIIPARQDIIELMSNDGAVNYKNQYWYQGLKSLAVQSNGGFVDLLDSIPPNYLELFHSCDDHWSIEGNRWAASKIYKIFQN